MSDRVGVGREVETAGFDFKEANIHRTAGNLFGRRVKVS
jgi:hypothetical protein